MTEKINPIYFEKIKKIIAREWIYAIAIFIISLPISYILWENTKPEYDGNVMIEHTILGIKHYQFGMKNFFIILYSLSILVRFTIWAYSKTMEDVK